MPIWRQRVKHAISVGRGPCSCTRACWCATCAAASTRSARKAAYASAPGLAQPRLPPPLACRRRWRAAATAALLSPSAPWRRARPPPWLPRPPSAVAAAPAGLRRGDAGVPDRHQRCPLLQVRVCRTGCLSLPARCRHSLAAAHFGQQAATIHQCARLCLLAPCRKSEGMKSKAAGRAADDEPPPPPPVAEALRAYVQAIQQLLQVRVLKGHCCMDWPSRHLAINAYAPCFC